MGPTHYFIIPQPNNSWIGFGRQFYWAFFEVKVMVKLPRRADDPESVRAETETRIPETVSQLLRWAKYKGVTKEAYKHFLEMGYQAVE